MDEELAYKSATELLGLYRSSSLSPVETMAAILARIETVNPKINAIYFLDAKRALQKARISEQRWRRGEPLGLLDGISVTVKDHIPVRGMPSFHGTRATAPENALATSDAPLVERLEEHGAIVIGKTTMPDFGMVASGVSSRHGVTRNPWNLAHNSGGSSSGSAAALAAGLCSLSVGSDIGGSVRIPSAFCGTFGLKPSYGRVPYDDPAPWLVAGPMTRSVADSALMMNVISRFDVRDYSALPVENCDYLSELDTNVRGVLIGCLEDIGFGLPLDPEIREALINAGKMFESLGAIVEPVAPIFEQSPEPDFDRCVHVQSYLKFSSLTPQQQELVLPEIAAWCRAANAGSALDLMRSLLNVRMIRRKTLAPFARYDFLICPTMAILPYQAERAWPIGGSAHNPFCFPFNISEQPAASINVGFSRSGLPIGLQIIGRRFDDRGVLRVAQALERSSSYVSYHPNLLRAEPPQVVL